MWGSLELLLATRFVAVLSICLLALIGALAGCGGNGSSSESITAAVHTGARRNYANATLRSAGGSEASGTAAYAKSASGYLLKVEVRGLPPARGRRQYGLWQLESPKDRVSLKTPDDMVALATYHVGSSGDLSAKLEPTPKAFTLLEGGHLTHFLITRIDDPERLEEAILEFDETGKSPDLGAPIAEGTFSGPLVGAASQR